MAALSTLPLAVIFTSCSILLAMMAAPSTSSPLLNTTLGSVRGIQKSAGGGKGEVEIFYGIPFAKPPVGNLRFRTPEEAEPWGPSVLDGTVMPNACWQAIDTAYHQFPGVNMWNPNTERSEDCLYLNIWRPESKADSKCNKKKNKKQKKKCKAKSHKSIMVWIFGGGFFSGSATLDVYDATQLAAREDVIVVTIGYRSGPMGYLYLGNDEVPGNAGMFDQVLALSWLRDNAENLGGSPDDITIFGESAGGVSVGLHMMSPMTRDLFTNGIMESSTPLAEWGVMDTSQALARSLELADLLCKSETKRDDGGNNKSRVNAALKCLQDADPSEIADSQWLFSDLKWFDVTLGPVVDGTYLPEDPEVMLRNGDIKLTNLILGVNKDEGIYFDLYGFMDSFPLNRKGELNESEFKSIMLTVAENDKSFRDQLIEAYSGEETGSHLDIVDGASGDYLFKCSVVDFAREYVRVGGTAYLYSFEENLSSDPWPDWMGVPHGYEVETIFGIPLAPGSTNTKAEKKLTKQVMDKWATFAKTGNPNKAKRKKDKTFWPAYTLEKEEYVVINTEGWQTSTRLREEECKIWANHRQQSRK